MEAKQPDREAFWRKNQVVITFLTSDKSEPTPERKRQIINRLPFAQFDHSLRGQLRMTLRSFGPDDVPRDRRDMQPGGPQNSTLSDLYGKYMFPSPDGDGSVLIACFNVDSLDPPPPEGEKPESDRSIAAVNHINNMRGQFIDQGVRDLSAMPNWFGACTGDVSHGCPITPPVPFVGSDRCTEDSGRWPITVPQLSEELQNENGDGVTVFVLDTFPKPEAIGASVTKVLPSEANKLLVDMAQNMVEVNSQFTPILAAGMAQPPAINFYYADLPDDHIAIKDQPKTGKDIDGHLVGYPIADHGLFVAGIIRTIARAASIVCVRILNDFGVGDISTLGHALESIATYVQQEQQNNKANLDYHPRFVVNMSMVVTPYDEQLQCLGLTGDISSTAREGLRVPLQLLANLGVSIVAAAGNDSSSVDPMGCMDGMAEMNLGPRYPAAFAESIAQVIPVGAVVGKEQAAPYSDYPGTNGVATYGGGFLKRGESIDSLLGVYTTSFYPALSQNDNTKAATAPADLTYPTIDVPSNNDAWAYWSGTSFATPIIAGLAARILQAKASPGLNVRQEVIALAGTNTVPWPDHDPVRVIDARQCKPANPVILVHP